MKGTKVTIAISLGIHLISACRRRRLFSASISSQSCSNMRELMTCALMWLITLTTSFNTLLSYQTMFETTTLPVFWIRCMAEYPEIATRALKALLPFPTSYLCDMHQNKTLDISNTFRVSLSPIIPRWDRLVAGKQAHCSRWFNLVLALWWVQLCTIRAQLTIAPRVREC